MIDNNEIHDNESNNIADYINEDLMISDIPGLDSFFSGFTIYNSLNRLLSGSEPKVALKIYTLHYFVNSKDKSVWTIQDINTVFHFIREKQRISILNQLRAAKVIELDYNDNLYKLTDMGFKLHSLLSTIIEINEDDSLGVLTTKALQSNILKKNPEEALRPLLQKLNHSIYKFQEAMRLRSEKLIREYLNQLPDLLKYHELATKVVHKILNDAGDKISRELHLLAQQIGEAQASLSQFSIKMERALNQIERQKLNLQDIGVGTGELQLWLKNLDEEKLATYSSNITRKSFKPIFMTNQFIDEAEYELFEADYSNENTEEEILTIDEKRDLILQDDELSNCRELVKDLSNLTKSAEYTDLFEGKQWEEICYRMSMMSILGSEEKLASKDDQDDDLMQHYRSMPFIVNKETTNKNLYDLWDKEVFTYDKEIIQKLKLKALSKATVNKK